MRVRAKREEDREMLISGGGAAAMLPSPTSRFMYFLHWVWEEIYDSAAPLCSCMCPPPTPAESQGCREMLGRYFFCPQPRTAREPMTADYGTSRSEAAIMRSLGFGWGIRVRGSTHTHSPGRGANLSSDHEVLVFLIVKIHVLRQRCYMDPAYGSAPCSSQLHRSGVCTIISPPLRLHHYWSKQSPFYLIASAVHPVEKSFQLTVPPHINHTSHINKASWHIHYYKCSEETCV